MWGAAHGVRVELAAGGRLQRGAHACGLQENEEEEGKAYGHAGIVAAASAVLADLEKGGILRVSCPAHLPLMTCPSTYVHNGNPSRVMKRYRVALQSSIHPGTRYLRKQMWPVSAGACSHGWGCEGCVRPASWASAAHAGRKPSRSGAR